MLKLFIISPDGKRYNISSITKDSISLSSNIDNIVCEMEFELAYNYRDKLPFSPIAIEDGACFVELYEEDTLLFQGIIPKFQVQRENPKFNTPINYRIIRSINFCGESILNPSFFTFTASTDLIIINVFTISLKISI